MKKLILLFTFIFVQNCWGVAKKPSRNFVHQLVKRESGGTSIASSKEAITKFCKIRDQYEELFAYAINVEKVVEFCLSYPASEFFNDAFDRMQSNEYRSSLLKRSFKLILDVALFNPQQEQKFVDILKLLVTKHHIDVNYRIKSDSPFTGPSLESPLHRAVERRSLGVSLALLEFGASKTIKNHNGHTPYKALKDRIRNHYEEDFIYSDPATEEALLKLLKPEKLVTRLKNKLRL